VQSTRRTTMLPLRSFDLSCRRGTPYSTPIGVITRNAKVLSTLSSTRGQEWFPQGFETSLSRRGLLYATLRCDPRLKIKPHSPGSLPCKQRGARTVRARPRTPLTYTPLQGYGTPLLYSPGGSLLPSTPGPSLIVRQRSEVGSKQAEGRTYATNGLLPLPPPRRRPQNGPRNLSTTK